MQYAWSKPVAVDRVDVYWALDAPRGKDFPGAEGWRITAPCSYRVPYWSGSDFVPVADAKGLGLEPDKFNSTIFRLVTADKIRLEVMPDAEHPAGVLECRVFSAGAAPSPPPVVNAG